MKLHNVPMYIISPFTETELELFDKNPTGIVAEKVLSLTQDVLNYANRHTEIDAKEYKSEIIKVLAEKLPE